MYFELFKLTNWRKKTGEGRRQIVRYASHLLFLGFQKMLQHLLHMHTAAALEQQHIALMDQPLQSGGHFLLIVEM